MSCCVPTQEGLPNCSFAKGFDPELEANGQNQNSITKQLNDTVASAPLFTQGSCNAKCKLAQRENAYKGSLEKLVMNNHLSNMEVSLRRNHLSALNVERSSVAGQLFINTR